MSTSDQLFMGIFLYGGLYILFYTSTVNKASAEENLTTQNVRTSTALTVMHLSKSQSEYMSTSEVDLNTSETSTQLANHKGRSDFMNEFLADHHESLTSDISTTLTVVLTGLYKLPTTTTETPRLYIEMRNESLKELYVGMKTDVLLRAIYTKGVYDYIGLRIETKSGSVDFDYLFCFGGRDVEGEGSSPYRVVLLKETGFFRSPMSEFLRYSVNISGSYTEDARTDVCYVTLYFHNADNVMDGESITSLASLKLKNGNNLKYLTKEITFKAKTLILTRSKTAIFDVNNSIPNVVTAEKKVVTKIKFTHWIPYYRPLLEIAIYNETDNLYNFITSIYLRVVKVGNNFYPGVSYLKYACIFPDIENGILKLTFPSHWVNRNYYYSEQTTSNDSYEFEAGITLSESAPTGINKTFRIVTFINNTRVWNSSFTLTTDGSSLDMMPPYNMSLHRLTINDLYPSSKVSLLIQISIPSLLSNTIYLSVSTFAVTDNNSIAIESVSVYNTSSCMLCTSVNESNQMEYFSYDHKKHVTINFINSADYTENINLLVGLRVDRDSATFGKIHAVAAESNNRTVKYKLTLNSPMILHDTVGRISSELFKILDGNHSSCIELPKQGERPPWFWLTINTSWLRIDLRPYYVTVVGDQISCNPHGHKLLQVTYPLENAHSDWTNNESKKFATCELVHVDDEDIKRESRLVECEYQCKCSNILECQEINLYMANQWNGTNWKLCELTAKNTF